MTSSSFRLDQLHTKAERSERVTWQGREALRLENGLALAARAATLRWLPAELG